MYKNLNFLLFLVSLPRTNKINILSVKLDVEIFKFFLMSSSRVVHPTVDNKVSKLKRKTKNKKSHF